MPMSDAACGLNDTARIAVPILVRITRKRNPPSNPSVTNNTTMSLLEMTSWPTSNLRAGNTSGNGCGVAPKISCPAFSSNSETPMAVMSTVSFDRSRKGR